MHAHKKTLLKKETCPNNLEDNAGVTRQAYAESKTRGNELHRIYVTTHGAGSIAEDDQ